MIFYQLEHPDYGWLTYKLDGLLDAITEEIEANNLFPGELAFNIRVVEMDEAKYNNLPTTDEIYDLAYNDMMQEAESHKAHGYAFGEYHTDDEENDG